jgi:hypothetical protein
MCFVQFVRQTSGARNPMEHRNCIFRFADVEVAERAFSVTKAGELMQPPRWGLAYRAHILRAFTSNQ